MDYCIFIVNLTNYATSYCRLLLTRLINLFKETQWHYLPYLKNNYTVQQTIYLCALAQLCIIHILHKYVLSEKYYTMYIGISSSSGKKKTGSWCGGPHIPLVYSTALNN